jgi:hypothetical protein
MTKDRTTRSNAASHVNRIHGVRLDGDGFIHTEFGSYHPVTGEGLPIGAPKALMYRILVALIDDGLDSGIAEDFDFETFIAEMKAERADRRG